jgi:hypothetical protein
MALVTNGVAGAILILGAAAAYLLTRAGPEALAGTSRALITIGLVGLLLMAAVVAVRLSLTARGHRGGHGGGDHQPPAPVPARPMDDLDAELFRIIDDARLRGF